MSRLLRSCCPGCLLVSADTLPLEGATADDTRDVKLRAGSSQHRPDMPLLPASEPTAAKGKRLPPEVLSLGLGGADSVPHFLALSDPGGGEPGEPMSPMSAGYRTPYVSPAASWDRGSISTDRLASGSVDGRTAPYAPPTSRELEPSASPLPDAQTCPAPDASSGARGEDTGGHHRHSGSGRDSRGSIGDAPTASGADARTPPTEHAGCSAAAVAPSTAVAHSDESSAVAPPPRLPVWSEAELAAELARLSNRNRLRDFEWLSASLGAIVQNRAPRVEDLATRAHGVPLFVVAGACPSSFAPMQAVMYTFMHTQPAPCMDFWWVKPSAKNGAVIEEATLHRHSKGAHKNDPGRSRALYAQFSDLFSLGDGRPPPSAKGGGGKVQFDVGEVGGARRAFIKQLRTGERYWVYLIWLEDMTLNPFARSKYVRGKLVYQREPTEGGRYFARPFAYRDGVLSVPDAAELEQYVGDRVLPPDWIKLGCTDDE